MSRRDWRVVRSALGPGVATGLGLAVLNLALWRVSWLWGNEAAGAAPVSAARQRLRRWGRWGAYVLGTAALTAGFLAWARTAGRRDAALAHLTITLCGGGAVTLCWAGHHVAEALEDLRLAAVLGGKPDAVSTNGAGATGVVLGPADHQLRRHRQHVD